MGFYHELYQNRGYTIKRVDNVLLLLVFKEIHYLLSRIMISLVHGNSFIFCYLIIIIFRNCLAMTGEENS